MDDELKECPFCGSVPDIQEIEAHKHHIKLGNFTMPDHHGCFTLECSTPGCCAMIADTKSELVAAWERRAIAPPVAAGSVDTPEFRELLGHYADTENPGEVISRINAWGAQQRETEKLKVEKSVVLAVDQAHQQAKDAKDLANKLRERAEKAEADLRQVNEWRAAALAESQMLGELWAAKVDKSEARVAELQEALDVAMLVVSLHAQ